MSQSKLKICILGPAHPYRGGIAAFNERLAQSLIQNGHDVTIVTFSLLYPSIFFPGKTQYTSDPPPQRINILRKINTINPFNWSKTGKWIRDQDFDLILSRFWLPVVCYSLGVIVKKVIRDKNTVSIGIIDNIIPHERRPGDKYFTNYYTGAIQAGLTLSKKVQKVAQSLYPSKDFFYSPHPLYDIYGPLASKEDSIRKLKLDDDKKYILFFGYIREYKGLDLLMRAFQYIHKKIPELRLLVAGEFYSNEEKYLNLIEELKIKDKVIMHNDFISDEMVKYYFGASDLISQTYNSASQSGISQIAIHFEKPMICTDVGGLPEVVSTGVNGLTISTDPKDIADGIDRYFSNPGAYYDPEEIKNLKKLYSWQTFTEEVMRIFQNLKDRGK